eukprot:5870292-Pleurochrysis_carterae.AAC.2
MTIYTDAHPQCWQQPCRLAGGQQQSPDKARTSSRKAERQGARAFNRVRSQPIIQEADARKSRHDRHA